jgi:hypothetical protein
MPLAVEGGSAFPRQLLVISHSFLNVSNLYLLGGTITGGGMCQTQEFQKK